MMSRVLDGRRWNDTLQGQTQGQSGRSTGSHETGEGDRTQDTESLTAPLHGSGLSPKSKRKLLEDCEMIWRDLYSEKIMLASSRDK